MLKSDLVQTDKHSIKILLRRKNLRFLRRTNLNTKPLIQFILNLTKQKFPPSPAVLCSANATRNTASNSAQ